MATENTQTEVKAKTDAAMDSGVQPLPCSDGGAVPPHLVIRGGNLPKNAKLLQIGAVSDPSTTIDYLSFRTQTNPFALHEYLKPVFGTVADMLTLETGGKGVEGWTYSADLMISDIKVGTINYGGETQRGWVRCQLPGAGCDWVQRWDLMEDLGGTLAAEIRRLDIAYTTYEREVMYQDVLLAHAMGEFKGLGGGRNPSMKTIESSDPMAGNTAYIGLRSSDKMLRCYEKGKESLKALAASQRAAITTYQGHHIEDVFRVELELKAKETFIPWPALQKRDQVFAGAYPFTAKLMANSVPWKMQKLPDFKPRATMTKALESCRHSYGGILRGAFQFFGGDHVRVLEMLMAEKPSDKLVEAGVFTI